MQPDRDTNLTEALDGIWYSIDRDLVIRAVSRKNWAISAEENNLSEAFSADRIVGESLMRFLHGEETQALYRRFCDTILAGKQDTISLVYRCDAPGVSRRHRLSIRPLLRGTSIVGAVFHNVEISAAPRPPIDLLLNGTADSDDLTALSICSFCRQVRLESDPQLTDWMPPEDYYRHGGSSNVLLSHSICDCCRRSLIEPETRRPPTSRSVT